jgi:hypothetical protein
VLLLYITPPEGVATAGLVIKFKTAFFQVGSPLH